ncbi:TPA: DUF3265 domain-containing protein [Vibrio vulnificus]|nr:DUF3265 domain-containing protein [Vibrio vulnificus]
MSFRIFESKSANKAFKRDSCRVAFLVCGDFWYAVIFGGESGLQKVGLSGIHPLTRRYA